MNHGIHEIYISHQFDQFSKIIVNIMIFVLKLLWCECLFHYKQLSSNYQAIFICNFADENEMKIGVNPPLDIRHYIQIYIS